MDKILEKLKELGKKIIDWWNRFTTRQKTLIVSAVLVAVIAIVAIVTALTRPQYVLLMDCEDTTQASEVRDLLDGEGLDYTVSDDGLEFKILKEQQSDANLLLGANSIKSAAYTIENVTDGSFTTTESDKQKRYVVYLESKLETQFVEKFNAIKSASVTLNVPQDDGTLIANNEESYASILLELQDEFTTENAAYMARAVATAIGNTTTNNIVIMDTEGNMLFSGDDNYTVSGTANAQLSVKSEAERLVTSEVKTVLLGTNEYDSIEVAPNLVLDFSTKSETEHTYTPADGQTQGVLSHEDIYNSENNSGVSGIPGTDSNDETSYVIQDNENSSASVSEESRDYLPNEKITNTETPAGLINYAQSSLSVTAIKYEVVKEEDVETQGLLDGITWEEYKIANDVRTKLDVDEDMVNVVAMATGIAAENIAMVAYSENIFFDAEGSGITFTDVLQIALIVIILALLAFVVLRSMRSEKQEEEEEEISVETLLQSIPEQSLTELSLEEESEAKKLVNRFVDENPEAAASLLRNWLNEDWG